MQKQELNALTQKIIGAAIDLHKTFGPGLLEKTYELLLFHELKLMGLKVEKQKPISIVYKGLTLDEIYFMDLLVEDTVILEIKSVDRILKLHEAQALTYARLAEKPLALVLNFNTVLMKNGIKRIII